MREMNKVRKIFDKVTHYHTKRERGATAVEYALIIALVVLTIIVGVTAFGGGLNTAYQNIATNVQAAVGS